jgi:hypothetical protein
MFVTLVLSLNKNSPALKKRIPFPDYKSKTASSYAKSPYRVYEICGTTGLYAMSASERAVRRCGCQDRTRSLIFFSSSGRPC